MVEWMFNTIMYPAIVVHNVSVGLLKWTIQAASDAVLFARLPHFSSPSFFIVLVLCIFLSCILLVTSYWRFRKERTLKSAVNHVVPRFRNRDKLRYYALHFRRRFRSITAKLNSIKSPEARQQLIIQFVRKVLKVPDDVNKTTLNRYRLPESFYEPDEDEDLSYPDDLKLMISSIRVFGHLEKSFFIEFCKFISTTQLKAGDYLFRLGDPDENVYVVQAGIIQLYIVEADGSRSVISQIPRGGGIDSFMSVLNVLSGNVSNHSTMEAVATEPTTVLKLPIRAFLEICESKTPAILRILQMTTVRLQRLAAVAVHSHLGLYSELINKECLCRLNNSRVQECLKEVQLVEPIAVEPSEESDDELALPIIHRPTVPMVLHSIDQSDLECVDLDTDSAPLDKLKPGFDPTKKHLAIRDAHGGLEFGEAPTLSSLDKSALRSGSPSGSTVRNQRSRTFGSINRKADTDRTTSEGRSDFARFHRASLVCTNFNNDDAKAKLLAAAEDDLAVLFGMQDSRLLRDKIVLKVAPTDYVISKESELQAELYCVLSGELMASQSSNETTNDEVSDLFVCHSGDVIGLLGLITGEPNVYTVKSTQDTLVASLSRDDFYEIIRLNPDSLFSAIRLIGSRVSPLLHQLDFAIQWITIVAGKALYKKGDTPGHVYVVLSGRLRQVDLALDGSYQIIGESGRGDMVGFLEVVCSQKRVHTVIAIRDSEVAQIPAGLLHHLKHKVPQLLNRIIQLLSGRLLGSMTTPNRRYSQLGINLGGSSIANSLGYNVFNATSTNPDTTAQPVTRCTMSNLRTIAILPTSSSINAEAFALEMQHSLTPIGSSIRLTSHIVRKRLGPTALASINQYRLNAWISHQEDLHRIVFFVCNYARTSAWNRLCIRQADCVLVLALGSADPTRLSSIEAMLKNHPTKVVKALVLMYPVTTDYPSQRQTAKWLNARPWISHHYHIRCESRVFTALDPEDLVKFYSNVFARERPNLQSDFSRLARYLTGEAVGLVLGGGGARGFAHIGVIRAFLDAGLPIDLIGGTSMGAFMSALWAEETRYAQFTQRARNFTRCMSSVWNKIKDFTYPAVSIFSGREFNYQLMAVFRDRQVEDLWIPSFYVTTDITNCRVRVHTQGSLWRYVRASMSLSGYFPPLCDPYDGSLLLDGGYINNVPADLMSAFGAKTIFAVDVGATVDTDFSNYGDHLSGWQLLYNRFFGSNKRNLRVPNLSEIQARLAYISCVRHLEQVKESGICHYLRPPIDHFMTLQFGSFEEIVNVGYEYGKEVILKWNSEDVLRRLVPGLRPNLVFDQPTPKQSPNRVPSDRVNLVSDGWLTQSFDDQRTFVDLAETLGPGSPISNSATDAESGEYYFGSGTGFAHGIRNLINRSSFRLPRDHDLQDSKPFSSGVSNDDRVTSLSRTVYSYWHSARHLVSQSLPNTGSLFRRRALSDNLCIPSDSHISQSSNEAGRFSDAHDYPGCDDAGTTDHSVRAYLRLSGSCTELSHEATRSSTDRINEQLSRRIHAPMAVDSDVFRKMTKSQPLCLLSDEDRGYLEDSESDRSSERGNFHLKSSSTSKLISSSQAREVQEWLLEIPAVSERKKCHKRRRRSSLDRIRSVKRSPPVSPSD